MLACAREDMKQGFEAIFAIIKSEFGRLGSTSDTSIEHARKSETRSCEA